jgi:hypothetical protein
VVEARPGTTRSPSPGELPERRAEELPERHTASQGKSLSADTRRDTYPSGMARDMGAGMQVYVLHAGMRGRREDLVETLADAPPDDLGTVDEQRAFHDTWIADRDKR